MSTFIQTLIVGLRLGSIYALVALGYTMIGVIPLWDDKRKSLWMLPGYLNGIREAGGLPVMLPLEVGSQDVFRLCSLCDGLLFTGGQDVDPALYHAVTSPLCGAPCPARDHLETLLFRQAFDEDKPMLGICRGVQLMNALLGGTLYQHLPDELSGFVNHQMSPPYDLPCHTVQLENGGMQLAERGLSLPFLAVNETDPGRDADRILFQLKESFETKKGEKENL